MGRGDVRVDGIEREMGMGASMPFLHRGNPRLKGVVHRDIDGCYFLAFLLRAIGSRRSVFA